MADNFERSEMPCIPTERPWQAQAPEPIQQAYLCLTILGNGNPLR